MKFVASLLVLAVVALAVACEEGDNNEGHGVAPTAEPTAQGTQTPAIDLTTPVGADAVWPIPESLVQDLQACQAAAFECVSTIIMDAGASEAAVDFFGATGWFLAEFRDLGAIDLGMVVNPWRANSNTDWVLLNGEPPAVFAEDAGVPSMPANASDAFGQLRTSNPELTIWPSDAVYESAGAVEGGGQSFIFQYSLNDGCHACATGYFQRVSLNLGADGTYQRPQLIDVCRGPTASPAPDGPAVDSCPTPEASP